MVNRLLEYYALTPTLAFEAGDELGEAVEAFADCLASFLF